MTISEYNKIEKWHSQLHHRDKEKLHGYLDIYPVYQNPHLDEYRNAYTHTRNFFAVQSPVRIENGNIIFSNQWAGKRISIPFKHIRSLRLYGYN